MTAVKPANLEPIFSGAHIAQVYANGGKAYEICKKYDIASVSVLNYWIRDYRRSVDVNGNFSLLKILHNF